MSYLKPFHTSIELLGKVFIKNLRAEATTEDPTTNIDQPGRIWYDKTQKTWKTTVLDANGQTVIESAPTRAEITAIQNAASTQAIAITALQTADTAINTTINQLGTTYLKLDGTNALTGALNVGGNRIVSVGDASATTDGVNKGQVAQAISTATADLVSTSAMTTAINAALAQHVTGILQFAGDVFTHTASGTTSDTNPTDITQWVGSGKTAGSAFRVKPKGGQTTCYFQYGNSNIVEAKVGDLLIIGPSGELIVDDNTQAPVAAASSYVTVTGDSSTGFNVDLGTAAKLATDKAVYTDGTRAMTGGLDMGTHVITNLKPGVDWHEAINKNQTDTALDALAGKIAEKIGGGLTQIFKNVTAGQGCVVSIDPSHNMATWDAATNDWIFNGLISIYVRQAGSTAWQQAEVYTELVTYGSQSGNAYGHIAQFQFVPEAGGDDFMVVIGAAKPISKSDFVVTV